MFFHHMKLGLKYPAPVETVRCSTAAARSEPGAYTILTRTKPNSLARSQSVLFSKHQTLTVCVFFLNIRQSMKKVTVH